MSRRDLVWNQAGAPQRPRAGCDGSDLVRSLALALALAAGNPASGSESQDMIGKWAVDAIVQPDPTNPSRTCTVHPKPGSMYMTIDHATITTAVSGASSQVQLEKQRYEILDETPSRVLLRVLSAKPYNITISSSSSSSSQPAAGELRWTTGTFVINLVRYDAQAISRQLAEEARLAQQEATTTVHAAPVADQDLQGTVGGHPWVAVSCVPSPVQLSSATIRCAIRNLASDAADASTHPQLLIELPRTPGRYPLGPTCSVTFCVPPASNLVGSDGVLVVTSVGAQELVFSLSVRFDADNQVNGHLRLLLPAAPAK